LVAIWMAVGCGCQRRSHFWVRFSLAFLGLPSLLAIFVWVAWLNVVSDGAGKVFFPVLLLLGVVALMFVPGLLYRGTIAPPGSSESDGGGGSGPRPPGPSPSDPRGGIPLPDADQASARVRDHNSPKFEDQKRRRPTHDSPRTPAKRPSMSLRDASRRPRNLAPRSPE
jgi:hypothetical protein